MNQAISLLVGITLVVGIGGLVYWQASSNGSANIPNTSVVETPDTESNATSTSGEITMAEVAGHAGTSSCWSVINGEVYDLTSWIPQHPGGSQAIIQLCGKDGSEKFNRQHGGQKMQLNILAGFKIGTLAH